MVFDTLEAEDPRIALRMAMLKRKAKSLDTGRPETLLVIPEDTIIYMSQRKPMAWFVRRRHIARKMFRAETRKDPEQQTFGFEVQGKTLIVAAMNVSLVKQCADYAAKLGLSPCNLTTISFDGPFESALSFRIPEKWCMLCRRCIVETEVTHKLKRQLPDGFVRQN